MENKNSCPSPQEVNNYQFFKASESRRDIFEIAKGVSEYLHENNVNQLVLIDRAARPAHVAIREYWKTIYPDEDVPKIYFVNPDGFSRINQSQKKIKQELESSYPELIKHKDEPLLIFDTCIHSGRTIKKTLKSFQNNGFSKIRTGFIYFDDACRNKNTNSLIDFQVLSEHPHLGCSPFRKDYAMAGENNKKITPILSIDDQILSNARDLRKEISQIVKEQLKIKSSEKISQPVYRPYLAQDLEYMKSIGGTPPQIAKDNPGKTMAELMTDEEILSYLNGIDSGINSIIDTIKERFIEKGLSPPDIGRETKTSSGFLEKSVKDLDDSLQYLEEIGRRPPEYSQK